MGSALLVSGARAQGSAPAPVLTVPARGSASIAELNAGLGVHTRVLVIGAHPDDEDTPLIAWLARGHRAETAYLSLTRGDGGQNLIGNELGEALGVIRTEELLAARRIDGAHQYFARAFDFGFSKNTTDAFKHWPHDSLLGDVVKVVRAFRPQIIVSVFSGTPRDGHGQHQVAGLLAREVYDAAADTMRFPVATYGPAWTVLKFYRGARFWPERKTLAMNVGEYNPNLGESYAEIAAESRSQHKSQGFGTARTLGVVMDYLTREETRVNASTPAKSEQSLFDGIDTTRAITEADRDALAMANAYIAVQAIAQREYVALGDSVPVQVSVYRDGDLDSASVRTIYAHGNRVTQPYWLVRPRVGDLFSAASDSIADDERAKEDWVSVPVTLPSRTAPVIVHVPAVYRYADPVRGDVQRPLVVTPAISVSLSRTNELARAGVRFERTFEVTLRSALTRPCTLSVILKLPAGMTAVTPTAQVTLEPGATRVVALSARGTLPAGVFDVQVAATDGTTTYTSGYTPIEYDHITPERMYHDAVVHIHSVDVKVAGGIRVGYVQGVGDNVAPTLRQLGVSVTMLDPATFPVTDLSGYSVIVVGTRAYEATPALVDNNAYLLNYARRGGHLVVQYGQNEMQLPGMMPYGVTLTRPAARVTEEDAPVRITAPQSRFMTTPNRITAADFDGWVQERAVYMPSTFDAQYETVLDMNDTGEPVNHAAILSTSLGKGRYTYVTLALFRQLPAGVPGGVRLFANLLTPAHP